MALWATLNLSVAKNADEGFKRRENLKGKNEKPQNFPYLRLTLSLSCLV